MAVYVAQNFGPEQEKWAKVFLGPNYKTWAHMKLGPKMGQRALWEAQLLAHLQNKGSFVDPNTLPNGLQM
jgi:hypothetical protein